MKSRNNNMVDDATSKWWKKYQWYQTRPYQKPFKNFETFICLFVCLSIDVVIFQKESLLESMQLENGYILWWLYLHSKRIQNKPNCAVETIIMNSGTFVSNDKLSKYKRRLRCGLWSMIWSLIISVSGLVTFIIVCMISILQAINW